MSVLAFQGWISQHTHLAGLAVFLIASTESLAIVGLLVPGVAMMFAAGALIGSGSLEFWPTCAYAVAGAITGDGISFWLGWHYRDRALSVWPFRKYPDLIARGEAFFRRHGGCSVLFGRFFGPVRAIIPLVAGMLAMPARQFLAVNAFSALIWAPVYLAPGMAVGLSAGSAAQVSSRITILVAIAAILSWLAITLFRRFVCWSPTALAGIADSDVWSLVRRRAGTGRIPILVGALGICLWIVAGARLGAGYADPRLTMMSSSEWVGGGWARLLGVSERYPEQADQPVAGLMLQWSARLEDVRSALAGQRWQSPEALDLRSVANILNPQAGVPDLVSWSVMFGQSRSILVMIRPASEPRWLSLHLSDSGGRLSDTELPVWRGEFRCLEAADAAGLFRMVRECPLEAEQARLARSLMEPWTVGTRTAGGGQTVVLSQWPASNPAASDH